MFTYAPPAENGCSASWYSFDHALIASTFAGSLSTPAKTEPQLALRYAQAVSVGPARCAAPSMGYMCIVHFQVGILAANSACFSTASSGIDSTKSARQYHWSPAGYSSSNALCSAGRGIGCTPSISRPGCVRATGNTYT